MMLQFIFPEGPRLRRLASTLALPKAGSRQDLAMGTATYAYFLSFPWDGRPVRRRRALDMRTMSVGSWFEALPWEGVIAAEDEETSFAQSQIPTDLQDTTKTRIKAGSSKSEAGVQHFFDDFFGE